MNPLALRNTALTTRSSSTNAGDTLGALVSSDDPGSASGQHEPNRFHTSVELQYRQPDDDMPMSEPDNLQCALCDAGIEQHRLWPCGHACCNACEEQWTRAQLRNPHRRMEPRLHNQIQCPVCRQVVAIVDHNEEDVTDWGSEPEVELVAGSLAGLNVGQANAACDRTAGVPHFRMDTPRILQRPSGLAPGRSPLNATQVPTPTLVRNRQTGIDPDRYALPSNLWVDIAPDTTTSDGLPRSLPPPECFRQLTMQCDPTVVLCCTTAISPTVAHHFQSHCPWLQIAPNDVVAAVEAIGVGMAMRGLTDDISPTSMTPTRCQRCQQCLDGDQVVASADGALWHGRCWHSPHANRPAVARWSGRWERPAHLRSPNHSPPALATVLALGIGGSATQALVAELQKHRMSVNLLVVASIPVPRAPDDEIMDLAAAAETSMGDSHGHEARHAVQIISAIRSGRGVGAERTYPNYRRNPGWEMVEQRHTARHDRLRYERLRPRYRHADRRS